MVAVTCWDTACTVVVWAMAEWATVACTVEWLAVWVDITKAAPTPALKDQPAAK